MNRKVYEVQTSLTLGYDSTVHAPTPKRGKTFGPGRLVLHSSDAPNGTVWFYDPDGERRKIDSGEVGNLVRRGVLKDARLTVDITRLGATYAGWLQHMELTEARS